MHWHGVRERRGAYWVGWGRPEMTASPGTFWAVGIESGRKPGLQIEICDLQPWELMMWIKTTGCLFNIQPLSICLFIRNFQMLCNMHAICVTVPINSAKSKGLCLFLKTQNQEAMTEIHFWFLPVYTTCFYASRLWLDGCVLSFGLCSSTVNFGLKDTARNPWILQGKAWHSILVWVSGLPSKQEWDFLRISHEIAKCYFIK